MPGFLLAVGTLSNKLRFVAEHISICYLTWLAKEQEVRCDFRSSQFCTFDGKGPQNGEKKGQGVWAKTSPVFWISPAKSWLWDWRWERRIRGLRMGLRGCYGRAAEPQGPWISHSPRNFKGKRIKHRQSGDWKHVLCQIQDRVGLGQKEMCFLHLGGDRRALLHSKRTDLKEWQEQRSKPSASSRNTWRDKMMVVTTVMMADTQCWATAL